MSITKSRLIYSNLFLLAGSRSRSYVAKTLISSLPNCTMASPVVDESQLTGHTTTTHSCMCTHTSL
jgi:hypothetical protein